MAGGIGGAVSSLFGGQNDFHADPYKTDPNAFQYGGQAGGADEAANRYLKQGEGAQGRAASLADYAQASQDRGMALDARGGQANAANLMMARAQGNAPSIAQMSADRAMGQAAAAQTSAAASARGPAAMALAQQQAAANTAAAQGNIAGQAQINAVQERQAAEQAAFGAYSGMRGGDLASQGQSAQQAQYQSTQQAQQRGQNDQYQLGMTQAEMGVRNAQLGASQNQQALNSANYNAAQGINAGVASQNSQSAGQMGMGIIGTGASLAGQAASSSDVRAKTDVQPMTAPLSQYQPMGTSAAHDQGADAFSHAWSGSPRSPETMARDDARARDEARAAEARRASDEHIIAGASTNPDLERNVESPSAYDVGQFAAAAYPESRPLGGGDAKSRAGIASGMASLGVQSKDSAAKSEPVASDAKKDSKEAKGAKEEKKFGAGDLLSGVGTNFQKMAEARGAGGGPAYTWGAYSAPQLIAPSTPELMRSDERTKLPASMSGVSSGDVTGAQGANSTNLAEAFGNLNRRKEGDYVFEGAGLDVPATGRAMNQHVIDGMQDAGKGGFGQGGRPGGMFSDDRTKTGTAPADPMASANHAMRGYSYAYKPEFAGAEGQQPGERNVGPMAQDMARNPVTATAIKKDPSTGLLAIDIPKYTKVLGASVASLQDQIDEMRSKGMDLASRRKAG